MINPRYIIIPLLFILGFVQLNAQSFVSTGSEQVILLPGTVFASVGGIQLAGSGNNLLSLPQGLSLNNTAPNSQQVFVTNSLAGYKVRNVPLNNTAPFYLDVLFSNQRNGVNLNVLNKNSLSDYEVGVQQVIHTGYNDIPVEWTITRTGSSGSDLHNLTFNWTSGLEPTLIPDKRLYRFDNLTNQWFMLPSPSTTVDEINKTIVYENFSGQLNNTRFMIASAVIISWTGNQNSDWNESGNWSSGIPTSWQDITIPSGRPNYPSLEVNPEVNDLVLESGATLVIPDGQHITISGTITNNGSVTVQDGGALVQGISSTLTGTGTYSVKRILPTADRFHYIGSPVNNVGVADFGIVPSVFNGSNGSQLIPQSTCDINALQTGSPWSNLIELREDASVLENCSQSLWHVKSAGTLTNGRGYAAMAYGASTTNLSFDGTVNNGTVTYSGLGNSGGTINNPLSDTISRGWHMVSNPYPSPITFGAGNSALTSMGFDAQVQVWNSALNQWIPTNDGTVIPVGQGFQIRNSDNVTHDFTVSNAMRTSSSATFYDMPWEQFVTVSLENASYNMQTVIFFHEEATDGYDGKLEANRLFGGAEVPVIYTLADSETEKMAFNGYAPLYNETKTVVLGYYDGGTPGNFSLRFQDLITLQNTVVTLEDTRLNTFTVMNEGSQYSFTTEADESPNRFRVHFNMTDVSSVGTQTESLFSVFPNPADEVINLVFADASLSHTLTLTDVSGKQLMNRNVPSGTENVQISSEAYASGIYLLEVRSSSGERNVVKIIKK